MFASQVRQIESHLREKGWLEMAYVYWFDGRPRGTISSWANGMKRLEKYAGPGADDHGTAERPVRRPCEHLVPGEPQLAATRLPRPDASMGNGSAVCLHRSWARLLHAVHRPPGDGAPRLALADLAAEDRRHACLAVELLTSSAAFPDGRESYEDPMGYVSGYSTARGSRPSGGNGDGRFIYPPLAATPSKTPLWSRPSRASAGRVLREGVEDYEYLYRLRELLAAKGNQLPAGRRALEGLLAVPASITRI